MEIDAQAEFNALKTQYENQGVAFFSALSETLDRVLNKGVVVCGEVVISVADIDLVYLGLQLVLTSVDTATRTSARRNRQEACTTRSEL